MPKIELTEHTLIDLDHLPEGFSREDAEQARALLIRLNRSGLSGMIAVASETRSFQLAVGEAETVHSLAMSVLFQAGQLFCDCEACRKVRSVKRVLS